MSDKSCLAIYRLPADLMFEGVCLGTEWPIQLGSLSGTLRLPSVDWTDDGHPFMRAPKLALPSIQFEWNQWVERSERDEDDPWFWGTPVAWTTERVVKHAEVGAVLLSFETVMWPELEFGGSIRGLGQPRGPEIDAMFGDVHAWFDRIAAWTRSTVTQDVDALAARSNATAIGQGLQVFVVDDNDLSTPNQQPRVTISLVDVEPLSRTVWAFVLDQANKLERPPVELTLLGAARIELHKGELRRAVIEAATAVELVLARLFDDALAPLDAQVSRQIKRQNRTLGTYVRLLSPLHPLPEELMTGLVEVRNAAIHKNGVPTHFQAVRAIEIAADVVKITTSIDPKAGLVRQ